VSGSALVRRISILARARTRASRLLFPGSRDYWEARYQRGRTSGPGSYGEVARFKAEFLNEFVRTEAISSVVEFGCGDGHQLSLASYPSYKGLDVSPTAVRLCAERFVDDQTKSFYLYDPLHTVDRAGAFHAELALSLDVIYHLVEDQIYRRYLGQLFAAASRYVIVFSSDHDGEIVTGHVRSRAFVSDVEELVKGTWRLREHVENPHKGPDSWADFYVFERADGPERGGQSRPGRSDPLRSSDARSS
jgi:SAM-dependent methyltransferase